MVTSLLPHITTDVAAEDVKRMRLKFRRLACVYEVMSTLCRDEGVKDVFVAHVDFEVIFKVGLNN